LIDRAASESAKMELEEGRRRLGFLSKAMKDTLAGGGERMEQLVAGIEQL
jgi:hypothetical protein